ncbi:MAG: ATP-binding protein, partial [Planctomycetota bacterium]
MPDFKAARNRDAWFVIRGYKYQIDHSILKWLRLDDDQLLVLESGEDIDIVNTALSRGSDGFDRTLEQIKHLDSPITLRVDAAKIAIANATQHRVSNPSLRLLFRFCTNATITSERPLLFEDRAPGIDIWEKLRTEQIAEPDRTRRLNKLLTFLRKLKKPAKGIDPTTWTTFTSFCSSCSLEELGVFIHAFEWSAVEPNMDDVSSEIRNYLHVAFDVPREQAQAVYSKLFLHIVQLLSQRGTKQLAAAALTPFLANPTLSASDAALLAFVQNQVLLHSVQLERLESASRTNEQAIAELREKFMEMAYGPAWSLNLSAAVAEIATTLPPQVRPIARRTAAIQTLKAVIQTNAWTAIYGSVGCGKTQLAALLGDQVQPIVYVSLRDLNPSEANFFLHHLFVQLCADHRTGTITRSALTALEVGTILILDDIPRVIPGDQLARRLVEIASVVHVRNQHLVSLSHHALPQSVVTAKGISTFSEIVAPRLIRDDVLEMLTQHDAPAQVATPVTIDALLTVTSGNPTLLAAAIRTLRSQEWRNVDE